MPTLAGKVGPGYSISLTRNGKKVTRLTAGTYKLVVRDSSSSHSFVLEKEKGGTFERDVTSVSFRGTKTLVIKVTKGTYKFYCRPHESMMFGFFTVT